MRSFKGLLVIVTWTTFSWKCYRAGFHPLTIFICSCVWRIRPMLPCVPSPLKCDWSCAVWISSNGVWACACMCKRVCVCARACECVSDAKLMEKLNLFLTVFWSLDWKWDSLLTLKVHLNLTRYSGGILRQWEAIFFFPHDYIWWNISPWDSVWCVSGRQHTYISSRHTSLLCVRVCIDQGW